jgi:uncharacterized membrane protein (UPF0182 family)
MPPDPEFDDRPQGVRRPRRSGRRRSRVLLPTILILVVLLIAFFALSGVYTEWLWYRSVGQSGVFTRMWTTKIGLFAVFGVIMAVLVATSAAVAFRVRPTFRSASPEQASLERYRGAIEPFRRVLFIVIPAIVGIMSGASAASNWQVWMMWRNARPFGMTDPQFHKDVSYYVFTYPFYRFVLGFLLFAVLLSLVAALVIHYVYGGIQFQAVGRRATPAAQAQLSVIIGIFVLFKAGAYWLDRYGLAIKGDSLVQGFTGLKYRDVHALLPAKTILAVVAIICAGLFIANVFRRTWTLPLLGLGLLVVSATLIGGIIPALVQQFQVKPSEVVKEQPYIQRNIDATLTAYGLTKVQQQSYKGNDQPSAAAIQADLPTLANVRLVDPALLSPTFRALQQVRTYYSFPDALNIDRYPISTPSGETLRGAVIAAREIDLTNLPAAQANWANTHLIYTHGYGVVAAYDNTVQSDGSPSFFSAGIPVTGLIPVSQPRIYFGQTSPDYSIVTPGSAVAHELDYPNDQASTGQSTNSYSGSGGVPMGSFFNRLMFTVKYQEPNILLSSLIDKNSRIMWDRQPQLRVAKVAPWLHLDSNVYPAVIDGKIKWIIDGYTTTNSFPYANSTTWSDATNDSLTPTVTNGFGPSPEPLNYLRNSVKAVVDAYDGSVTLYAWDESDPILKSWEGAFPGVVQPKSSIPASLMAHLRYPTDLFKVQRYIYSRYHVNDPNAFYSGQGFWIVPTDPTNKVDPAALQPPYFLSLQMPGQGAASFSLTTTFAPQKRQTLAAFMAVDSTPGSDFGAIRVLELPSETTLPGPVQVQNNFESDPAVSLTLSLLRGKGSEVDLGNLLSLPVGGGLLYVEPVYVRATTDGYPLLKKVLVGFGARVSMKDSFQAALADVFGTAPGGSSNGGGSSNTGTGTEAQKLAKAIADAQAAYSAGQAALVKGDFAAYGVAQKALADALNRAAAAEAAIAGTAGSTKVSPTPTPSPTLSPSVTPSPTGSSTTIAFGLFGSLVGSRPVA